MGTIADKLNLLLNTKAAIKAAIIGKGQTVADSDSFSAYPAKIQAIETGIQLPTLTNPGTAADLLAGKELIDQDGNPLTGTMPSLTEQTITPGVSDQVIAAGRYLSGAVTVSGDSNLVAANIKSGVSIFGVSGTYVGSGSYKIYSGTVEGSYTNFTAVANLDLPTGSDYLDTDKIVWVLIWNETVLEINEAPIVFWEYQRGYTGGGNRQEIGYMTTGDSHVGYGSQNWTVEAHNGYVTAGWRNTDWNCFDGAATYQYLIVSEI